MSVRGRGEKTKQKHGEAEEKRQKEKRKEKRKEEGIIYYVSWKKDGWDGWTGGTVRVSCLYGGNGLDQFYVS